MINIQKSYSVHFGFIRSFPFHIGPMLSTSVLFGPFSPLQSYLVHYVHFGPNLSIHSYSVHFNPIRSTLFPFCPIPFILFPFCPIPSTSVHFFPFMSTYISRKYLFRLRAQIQSTSFHLVQFDPFVSTSIHFCAPTYWEKKYLG